MFISLITYCWPFSLALTRIAFPKDPSPIFRTLIYLSIVIFLRHPYLSTRQKNTTDLVSCSQSSSLPVTLHYFLLKTSIHLSLQLHHMLCSFSVNHLLLVSILYLYSWFTWCRKGSIARTGLILHLDRQYKKKDVFYLYKKISSHSAITSDQLAHKHHMELQHLAGNLSFTFTWKNYNSRGEKNPYMLFLKEH